MAAEGCDGLELAGEYPLLDGGITDSYQSRGFAGGQHRFDLRHAIGVALSPAAAYG